MRTTGKKRCAANNDLPLTTSVSQRQPREDMKMGNQQHSERHEMKIPSRDDVARRAYELFQARGAEAGHDLEDWFEAEHELSQASASEGHDTSD
jgi:hypothetical protein